jgi:hypothetical protein
MPVAVVMLVIEKTAVRTTGIRKKRMIMIAAGAIITSPSVLDDFMEAPSSRTDRAAAPPPGRVLRS